MLDSEILKGNTALFLPKIQVEETGLYRCQLTVFPNAAQGMASLEMAGKLVYISFPPLPGILKVTIAYVRASLGLLVPSV